MTRSVGVVILNWQSYPDTARCVRTVLASSHPGTFPVVVDNASADDSWARLRAEFPEVEAIRAESNLGYAGGNNLGIRRALERGADYVYVINNDTEVPPDSVGMLVAALESDPGIGLVGPRVEDAVAPRGTSFGGEIRWRLAEARHIPGDADAAALAGLREVDYVPGTAVMARRRAIEEAGLLPEHYFLYFEDVSWSLRVRRAGWRTVVAPAASILHYESSTVGRDSPRKMYYYVRNNLSFLDEWVPAAERAAVRARLGWKLAKLAARTLARGKAGQVRAMVHGYRDYRAGVMWKTERV